jgi:hypothetical protein
MLNEVRITGLTYDAARDALAIGLDSDVPVPARALLLLDSQRRLVGLDLRDEHGRGVVAMAGPHEAVDSTQTVDLAAGPSVAKASRWLDVRAKNPYV